MLVSPRRECLGSYDLRCSMRYLGDDGDVCHEAISRE